MATRRLFLALGWSRRLGPAVDFARIIEWLRKPEQQDPTASVESIKHFLAEWKAEAVAAGDEDRATRAWCLERTLEVQQGYLRAFALLKVERFYDAWCELERAEIRLHGLERHFQGSFAEFRIDFIQQHIGRWQEIFPYRLFFSPEMRIDEKRCSICKEVRRIRGGCGHRVGQVYGGEYCVLEVTKMEFLGSALVSSPVQKYSVPFVVDPKTGESADHYDYRAVRYVVERLDRPFDGWVPEWQERRRPHSHYSDVGRDDPCPCERTGLRYTECCLLNDDGVLYPHLEITFLALPDDDSRLSAEPTWPETLKVHRPTPPPLGHSPE